MAGRRQRQEQGEGAADRGAQLDDRRLGAASRKPGQNHTERHQHGAHPQYRERARPQRALGGGKGRDRKSHAGGGADHPGHHADCRIPTGHGRERAGGEHDAERRQGAAPGRQRPGEARRPGESTDDPGGAAQEPGGRRHRGTHEGGTESGRQCYRYGHPGGDRTRRIQGGRGHEGERGERRHDRREDDTCVRQG